MVLCTRSGTRRIEDPGAASLRASPNPQHPRLLAPERLGGVQSKAARHQFVNLAAEPIKLPVTADGIESGVPVGVAHCKLDTLVRHIVFGIPVLAVNSRTIQLPVALLWLIPDRRIEKRLACKAPPGLYPPCGRISASALLSTQQPSDGEPFYIIIRNGACGLSLQKHFWKERNPMR